MKHMTRFSHLVLAAGLAGAFGATVPCAAAAAEERVVADVDGTAVTNYDVDRELRLLLPMQSESFHGSVSPEKLATLKETALTTAIERALKALGAQAAGVVVDEAAVDAELAKIAKRFKTEEGLVKALGGESVAAYKASLRRQLLAQRGEAAAVDQKAQVGEDEQRRWYDANRTKYQTSRMYKVSEIKLGLDPAGSDSERDAAFTKARELLGRARAGADFYDLAYYGSTDPSRMVGGDRGWIALGQNQPEFDEALARLHPGEVSDIVHTIYGFHILKLMEIQEPRTMTFDELKGTIKDIIAKERRQKTYDAWMKKLRARHAVVRRDK